MLPNFYDGEIPIKFDFVIIRQKALIGNLVEFIMEFKPLNNDYLSVFLSKGSDLELIYDWLSDKKILPNRDYYIANELSFLDDRFPRIPTWLTIFRNRDGILCCDYLNTKSYFHTDFLDFKGSMEDEELY